jgi:hypothetical protein
MRRPFDRAFKWRQMETMLLPYTRSANTSLRWEAGLSASATGGE